MFQGEWFFLDKLVKNVKNMQTAETFACLCCFSPICLKKYRLRNNVSNRLSVPNKSWKNAVEKLLRLQPHEKARFFEIRNNLLFLT